MNTCIYRCDPNGDNELEIDVEIRGSYLPYKAAKIYGDPDDCYPAEGGYAEDVVAIFMDGDKERVIPLSKKEEEDFESSLAEELADEAADAYDRAMEDKADAAREREWDP